MRSCGDLRGEQMRPRSSIPWIVCAVSTVCLVAGGCVMFFTPAPSVKAVTPITLLLSGEMNGLIEPCRCSERQLGGISRRAGIIKSIASQPLNVLTLDNGDVVSMMGRQEELKYETAIMAMNRMGYAAMGVGEGDLALGLDYLVSMQEVAQFPFLCANLLRDGKRVFPSHVTRPVKGGPGEPSVSVVGILSPKFDQRVKSLDPRLSVVRPGPDFRALIESLVEGSQLIVALAHMSVAEGTALAKQFPQLDVVVCGHGLDEPLAQPVNAGKALVVNTGTKGRSLVRLDIAGRTETGRPVAKYGVIRLLPELLEATDVATLFSEYVAIVRNEGLLDEMRRFDLPKGGPYAGSYACQYCHETAFDVWKKSAHAKALATLQQLTPRRDHDPECVACHVVGYPHLTGFESLAKTPALAGVGCESCHGPGAEHIKDTRKPYTRSGERECLACHTADQSPHFSYRKHFAKIKH
ncbi:MAG: hypothetical protein FJ272_00225 [Planctomycetes bacterium]|nr:hypothetical protein [Planctomycetota bacterium]